METAIPVSPTEDAMNLSATLRRMADAIVNASTMPETIKGLTERIETLQAELDNKTIHAYELDNSLREMRLQRDAAREERDRIQSEHDWTKADYARVSEDRDRKATRIYDLEQQIVQLGGDLNQARKDRDDHAFHALELQEKLDTTQSRLGELFGLVKPQAVPETAKPTEEPQLVTPAAPEPYYSHQDDPANDPILF